MAKSAFLLFYVVVQQPRTIYIPSIHPIQHKNWLKTVLKFTICSFYKINKAKRTTVFTFTVKHSNTQADKLSHYLTVCFIIILRFYSV